MSFCDNLGTDEDVNVPIMNGIEYLTCASSLDGPNPDPALKLLLPAIEFPVLLRPSEYRVLSVVARRNRISDKFSEEALTSRNNDRLVAR